LPPHAMECEQGVLGCMLLAPAVSIPLIREKLVRQAFYDVRHQIIFPALLKLYDDLQGVDVITLQRALRDAGKLDDAGGLEYLASLESLVPSTSNLSYYVATVAEKHRLRSIVQTCVDVVGRVYDYHGPIEDLLFSVHSDLAKLIDDPQASGISEATGWQELLDFDTEHDMNNIIGVKDGKTTRYLCRGHGAWLIGPSGVGKSSLMLQLGISFAAGRDAWGVAPMRPLRVLIVQAENDKGDIAEMAKGIESGLKLGPFDKASELVAQNVKVLSVSGLIGQRFCQWLRKEIIAFRAEVVLVDPLLSFAGINVGMNDQATLFCRVWLDPVLRETGAVLISAHHTGKPVRSDHRGPAPTIYDQAYAGLGASELVNWARAIMILQPVGDTAFKLVLSKRGKRAWAQHPNGEFTQTLWLRHAVNGAIFWEQIEPPVEAEKPANEPEKLREPKVSKPVRIATMNLHDFISAIPADGEGLRAITRRLGNWLASDKSPKVTDASEGTLRAAVAKMVENRKLAKADDLYRRGPNA